MPAIWLFPHYSQSFSMLLVILLLVSDLLCWLGNVWWCRISLYRVANQLAGVVVTVWMVLVKAGDLLLSHGLPTVGRSGMMRMASGVPLLVLWGVVGMERAGYDCRLACFAMSAVLTRVLWWIFAIIIAVSNGWIWFDQMCWEVIVPMCCHFCFDFAKEVKLLVPVTISRARI